MSTTPPKAEVGGSGTGAGTQLPADALLLHAEAQLERRDLPAALWGFDRAESGGCDADRCCAGRWEAAMLAGNFELAWRQSDAIRARGGADPHRFWQGEDLRGQRVTVRSLHGLGDAVQMLAYAPLLRERASHVVWEMPPRLVELARCFEGVEDVVTWGENAPSTPPSWDVQLEITELPYIFRATVADLPIANGYLRLPGAGVRRVSEAMGPRVRPRIGVSWSTGEWNPGRNLPLSQLAALVKTEGVDFWSLQSGTPPEGAEFRRMKDAFAVCGDGLVSLAATVANLDLVITPDTLQAHLAGALGVPAWVLLGHAADWRWMTERSDSPWYPSLRLFRQRVPGDWAGVFEQAARALPRVLPLAGQATPR